MIEYLGLFSGPLASSNQRFQDIQKQMTDRILAAQAESDRIIAQCTPELAKGSHRILHGESKAKFCGSINAQDGSRPERDNGSGSPRDVMSLTVNSPSLMLLKNLVKEKERRASLGNEELTPSLEAAAQNATDASVGERSCEDGDSDRLCSKGWLPIIMEGDERIAQSVEVAKVATPQGSGAKSDYPKFWTQVEIVTIFLGEWISLCSGMGYWTFRIEDESTGLG